MPGLPLFDSIRSAFRRSRREKLLQEAHGWPLATGEINHWKVETTEENIGSFTSGYQIEASFHFILKGEYYGGYVRSVPMGHHEAETLGTGSPQVHLRYNPDHPDTNVVLPEDNPGNLPFAIYTGKAKSS